MNLKVADSSADPEGGGQGVKVCLNGFLSSTFIVPRITHGLEFLTLTKKDIEMLEKFQRRSLKQIQSLPDKTPNVVTLGLLGILPVEAVIDKNALNLFMNVISDKNSIEYQIAKRQLAMKIAKRKIGLITSNQFWKLIICHQFTPYLTNNPPNQNGKKNF